MKKLVIALAVHLSLPAFADKNYMEEPIEHLLDSRNEDDAMAGLARCSAVMLSLAKLPRVNWIGYPGTKATAYSLGNVYADMLIEAKSAKTEIERRQVIEVVKLIGYILPAEAEAKQYRQLASQTPTLEV